jgi:hypothetical protein
VTVTAGPAGWLRSLPDLFYFIIAFSAVADPHA